jgi:hypothetical protein
MVEEAWNYVFYCDFTWMTNIEHFNVSYWNKNKIFLVKYSYKLVHHFGFKSTNHPFFWFVQFDTIESSILKTHFKLVSSWNILELSHIFFNGS